MKTLAVIGFPGAHWRIGQAGPVCRTDAASQLVGGRGFGTLSRRAPVLNAGVYARIGAVGSGGEAVLSVFDDEICPPFDSSLRDRALHLPLTYDGRGASMNVQRPGDYRFNGGWFGLAVLAVLTLCLAMMVLD